MYSVLDYDPKARKKLTLYSNTSEADALLFATRKLVDGYDPLWDFLIVTDGSSARWVIGYHADLKEIVVRPVNV